MSPYHFITIMGIAWICSSCTQHFSASQITRKERLHIEDEYENLLDAEDYFRPLEAMRIILTAKSYYEHTDSEGGAPHWSLKQDRLVKDLRAAGLSDKNQTKFRIYLIKKHGLVSSFIETPRSKHVDAYVSRPDAHALPRETILNLISQQKIRISRLADTMLTNPDLFK